MTIKRPSLIVQIFAGMLLGILVGHFWPEVNDSFKVLSDIFLRLIKMIIAPLVFTTLVVGIAKVGDFKAVGRIGIKTLAYFTFATLLALSLGLILVNFFQPGLVMGLTPESSMMNYTKFFEQLLLTNHFDPEFVNAVIPKVAPIKSATPSFSEFIKHAFPESVIDAMAKNEILPIVIFSIFFGIATAAIGKPGEQVIKFFDAVAHIMLKITSYVMKLAPLAIFGAISAVVAQKGLGILYGYGYLILCFYGGLIFFTMVILGGISTIARIPFFRLLSHVKEPILIAFSTASSEAAFPKTVLGLERFGCSNRIVSFVLPLGYSFNLDGSIMYMTFATMFIAQVYGIQLDISQQITMMLILLVTSKGMAGVPGASFLVIAGMLMYFGIPEQGLLLLMGIDRILDMGRSATNVVGNAVATAIVSKWEGELTQRSES